MTVKAVLTQRDVPRVSKAFLALCKPLAFGRNRTQRGGIELPKHLSGQVHVILGYPEDSEEQLYAWQLAPFTPAELKERGLGRIEVARIRLRMQVAEVPIGSMFSPQLCESLRRVCTEEKKPEVAPVLMYPDSPEEIRELIVRLRAENKGLSPLEASGCGLVFRLSRLEALLDDYWFIRIKIEAFYGIYASMRAMSSGGCKPPGVDPETLVFPPCRDALGALIRELRAEMDGMIPADADELRLPFRIARLTELYADYPFIRIMIGAYHGVPRDR